MSVHLNEMLTRYKFLTKSAVNKIRFISVKQLIAQSVHEFQYTRVKNLLNLRPFLWWLYRSLPTKT